MKVSNAVKRWGNVLKDYNPNLETMRSYAKKNNMNSHQASYWFKRFREDPKYIEWFSKLCKKQQNLEQEDKNTPNTNIECIEILTPPVSENIIIEHKDWKIHIPESFSSENLKKIVAILGDI